MLFRDLTPALADAAAFAELVDAMAAAVPAAVDVLVAVEARGFVVGAAVARVLGLGVALARKPGKLPVVAHSASYELEYGSATLELPAGVVAPGARAVVVDDVLATGGTLAAVCGLVETAGATVAAVVVAIEIEALAGRRRLPGRDVRTCLTL